MKNCENPEEHEKLNRNKRTEYNMPLNVKWEAETGKREWGKTNEIQIKDQFKVGNSNIAVWVPTYDKCSKAMQYINKSATV